MERITSRKNRMIASLRLLGSDAKERREQGYYVCDGLKLLEEAVNARAEIATVLWKEHGSEPVEIPGAQQLIAPEDVFEVASPMANSPGPVFTVKIPENREDITPRNAIVLENVQDPGNVGTVLRTANALGIGAVVLTGACADLYHPKTVRATMGAIFRQRVERIPLTALRQVLESWDLPLVGAVLSERAENILAMDLTHAAVAVGSEGSGLSRELINLCAKEVIIPMQPDSESLNAAVAASIIMWEMRGRML
ncbi:MAG: RNA methyltransferase [Oscillospiraceae bacterium]|nr:RNA methyltransferase [Oscillospiraceae bacterium]